MNEWVKGILVIVICSSLIIGFVFFSKALFSDMHYCEDSNLLERLIQGDKLYLECGIEEQANWTSVVRGNEIVREKNVIVEKESHIEEYDVNWTDDGGYNALWLCWLIVSLTSVVMILSWLKSLLKPNKDDG